MLTLIVAAESRWTPWAPFFLIYAVLSFAIPWFSDGWALGASSETWRTHGVLIAGIGAVMLIWEVLVAAWFYERVVLVRLNRAAIPRWSPTHAFDDLARKASRQAGLGGTATSFLFGGYTFIWAPIAEELFYWGYLYGNIRADYPFWAAAGVTALFFGVRHAAHFLFLGRSFPLPAVLWIAFTTFLTGIINSWLYERIGALLPLIILHLLVNVALAAYSVWALRQPSSQRGTPPVV